MNSSDFFFEAVTSTIYASPVVPTNPTCDCSGGPDSTPGELTIMALSAVSGPEIYLASSCVGLEHHHQFLFH